MSKPIFRWTIYQTSKQGLDLFIESIKQTPVALGKDTFDWYVTYNGDDQMYRTIQNCLHLSPVNINLIRQDPEDCPIPNNSPLLGLWKVCPPRLDIEVPEIICDNDIIFVKKFPKIDQFLETNRPLLVKDPIRFYGNFNWMHPEGENWNSGLLTLPINFNFAEEIVKYWESIGKPQHIGYAEEQAMLTKIIKNLNPVIVETDEIVELNKDGIPNGHGKYVVTGREYGFHFVESNRHYHHEAQCFINRSNPPPPIPIY